MFANLTKHLSKEGVFYYEAHENVSMKMQK